MFKKIMNVLSVVVLVVMVLFVFLLILTRSMGNTPSLFGYYVFRVSSDSMEPTMDVGDVILVKSADADDIRKDDVVTYLSRSGVMYGQNVTHRVVTEPYRENGTLYFQTQGDAVGAPLDEPITYEQIRGKYVRKLVLIGKFYSLISTPAGVAVFITLIVALFGYEMISLVLSYRKVDEKGEELIEALGEDTPEEKEPETEPETELLPDDGEEENKEES